MAGAASYFRQNEQEMCAVPLTPNLAEKAEHALPNVGENTAKTTQPIQLHKAVLAGDNLRNDYKAPEAAPKGDLQYGVTSTIDMGKEAIGGLLTAFKSKEPDVDVAQPGVEQPAVAVNRQPAVQPFGL